MSISENLVRIQNAVDAAHADKEMLRLAINAKGGTLPESAALADFAAQVNKLPAGGNTPGDTIDLSFITATAGDIRSGKIGADINGDPVNGTLVVESAGGGTAIYKCASVDVANKKWTGYKAVLTDGEYSFETEATPNLSFTTVTPAVGKYYTADALMSITSVWQGYLVHLSTAGEDGYDISKYAHGVFINDPDMVVAENGAFSFGGGYMGIDPLGDEFVFGTGDFTIEADITPQASDRRQCFCAYHNDGVFAICYSYDPDGKLGVFWRGNWSCHTWDCALTAGQEYHVAIVRNGNKLQLFVNDELQLTRDGTKYWDLSGVSIGESGQSFYFGRWGGDPGDFNGRWQGYMSDMKIANAALYAEVPPTPKMVFHAPLSEAKTTAETGQQLITSGDVTYTTLDGKACAKIGEPYETTGYIKTVENIGITGQASRTVSFWAHPTNEQEYCNAVGWGSTQSHGRLFNCGAANWGALYAEFTTWGNDIQHEFAVDDGKLHHFCYVYDEDKPETLVIYVDGVKNTFNVSGVATQDSPLWMGQSGAGNWNYTGHLAEVRVYNYALTENEVKVLAGLAEDNPDNPDNPDDTGLKNCGKCGSSNLKVEGSNVYRCQDCGTGYIATGFDPNGLPKYEVADKTCALCQTPLTQSQIKECSICTNQVCENCGDTLGTGAWQCYGC